MVCAALAVAQIALASNTVTLAWDPSPGDNIGSYKIYFGPGSGVYTNSVDVGNVTNATISGLVSGATYFFAATAMDTSGLESEFSNEVSYTVPAVVGPVPLSIHISAGRQVVVASTGKPDARFNILVSPDLVSWDIAASVTANSNGALEFVDPAGPTNRAVFYRAQLAP